MFVCTQCRRPRPNECYPTSPDYLYIDLTLCFECLHNNEVSGVSNATGIETEDIRKHEKMLTKRGQK